MSSIQPPLPPTGVGAEFSTPPSGSDPESQLFLTELEKYESTGTPAQQRMALAVLQPFNWQYPPSAPNYPPAGSHTFLETTISQLVSGTCETGEDFYMVAAITGESLTDIETELTSFLADMTAVAKGSGDSWSVQSIPPTPVDQLNSNVTNWSYQNPNSALSQLATQVLGTLNGIGSNGNPGMVQLILNNVFTDPDFFTKYASASYSQLSTFINTAYDCPSYFSPPSFSNEFASVAIYLRSIAPNSDDQKFVSNIFSSLQQGWANNDMTPFNTLWGNEIGTYWGFTNDYPHLDEQPVLQMEQIFNIQAPDLQHQIFETQSLANANVPQSQGWLLAVTAQDLVITASSVGANVNDLKIAWTLYTSASPANPYDIYMKSPLSSDATIAAVAAIMGNAPIPTKTPMDFAYQQAQISLQGLTQGTPDYQLFTDLSTQAYALKSQGDFSTLYAWANSVVMSDFQGDKGQYKGVLGSSIVTFLGCFSYNLTLSYGKVELLDLAIKAQNAQSPMQSFFIDLRTIFTGYMLSHPQATPADFQTYLNEKFAKTDFCFVYPGVPPEAVNGAFAMIGLTSPHVYGRIDDVYASLVEYNLFNNFKPDSAETQMLNLLYPELINAEGQYDPNHPNVDLYSNIVQPLLQNFPSKYPEIWGELQTYTQTLLNSLANLP